MPARKAYPSTRKARFRPRIRKKISKPQRRFKKRISKMAELETHEVQNENVYPLANLANPTYAPDSATGISFRRNACNIFIPTAFTKFNLGVDPPFYNPDKAIMEGQSIYARYLQMKIRLTFPSGSNILVPDQTLYLVHGYADPTKLTLDDYKLQMSNGQDAESPPKDKIDASYIPWHVMRLLHSEFNSEKDQMSWVGKKQRRGYSILGYNKVTVDKDTAITSRTHLGAVTPGIGVQEGGPPQIVRRITWPMNRKIQYTLSKQSDSTPSQNWFKYPNDNAIPFVCLFNPQWEKQGVDNRPDSGLGVINVETSSKLWYNDF